MKKKKRVSGKSVLVLILCLCMTIAGMPVAQAAPQEVVAMLEDSEYVLDEIIIKFVDPSTVPGKEDQLQREIAKYERIGFVEVLDVYVIKAADLAKNPEAVLNRFKNNKFIEYVEPNYIAKFNYIPNDPYYQPSAMNLINAPAGWEITKGEGCPVIAVIDSGIAPHQDLPPLLPGYAAVSGLSPNNDTVGHGTKVAGVLGAIGDNRIGVAGLNWNAKILPVKVDNAAGTLTVANIALGITWAANNGARVLNLSLSTLSDSITLRNAIDYAYAKGCAIFASTGNDGKNAINYPARYDNVIAVGSTGNGTARYTTSNYGSGMGVVANWSYYTTTTANGYALVYGTSVASPQAAGLASLIWAVNPRLSNDQVYRLIQENCKTLGGGYNQETGYGLIDCGKTLQAAKDSLITYDTPPIITLKGSSTITLQSGDRYEEPGYSATDCHGRDITADLNIRSNLDINSPGNYSILYEVTDAGGNTTGITRTVIVVEKEPQYLYPPLITLKGLVRITIEKGAVFQEPGYTAFDCLGVDLAARVRVSGNVDPAVPGDYIIAYQVTDDGGNTGYATRTVTVLEEKQIMSPRLTLSGANPVILHLGGSPYIERGALAYDDLDGDISGLVQISGGPDLSKSGAYTVTYRVVNSAGLEAVASRQIRILAPIEKKLPRQTYSFSGQGKAPATITHNGLIAETAGDMDLNISSLSGKVTLTVKIVNANSGATVYSDSFSAVGGKKYVVDPGRYNIVVEIVSGNGTNNYKINLLMPEVIERSFELPETRQNDLGLSYLGSWHKAA